MSELEKRLAQLTPRQRELLQRRLSNGPDKTTDFAEETIKKYPPLSETDAIALSSAQQKVWFFERLQPDAGAHNLSQIHKLIGKLDLAALESAFTALIHRHDALRMRFFEQQGRPVLTVAKSVDFNLGFIDLTLSSSSSLSSSLPQTGLQSNIAQALKAQLNFAFDLSKAPLLKVTVMQIGQDEYLLVVVLHHIISDAWSLGILIKEIEQSYNAICQKHSIEIDPPKIQFSDIIRWQSEAPQQQQINKQLNFWQQALTGTNGILDIATDKIRPNSISLRGARQFLELDNTLLPQLTQLAQQESATLFMLLLAAFQVLLSRHSGQDDIIVGSPLANRSTPETQSTIGFCVNTLPLRGDLSNDPTFRELLNRTRLHCIDALSHADAPLEKIIDQLKIERVPGRTPLFQTMFVLQNGNESQPKFHQLKASNIDHEMDAARFEITLSIFASDSHIEGVLDYNRDLFHASSMQRMAEQFTVLLQSIVRNPDCRISNLSLLSESAHSSLITLGHGGEPASVVPCQHRQGLYQLVTQQADLTPNAIALIGAAKTRTDAIELTYRQLVEKVNGVAHQLVELGINPNDRVAILADRSIESLIALLAILGCGATYVPLDPSQPDARLQYILDDANIRLLVTPPDLTEQANQLALNCSLLVCDANASAPLPPVTDLDQQNIAYIIYTSGSTGTPKGVMVSHANAINLVQGFLANHAFENQRLLMIPPLIFDASVGDIFPALAIGATLVLHPTPTELGSIELEEFCRQYQVSAIDAPAALWRRWTDGFALEKAGEVLPDLRLMMFGGESVPMELVKRFARLTGNRVKLSNHYGPTETSVCATMLTTIDGSEFTSNELSIGKPLAGVQIYILDNQLQLAPQGVVGELCIAGPGVTQGYSGAPELTAKSFVDDPFSKNINAKLYRSGDLARWTNDGTLQFIGRRDHQVKLRGVRIELGEVEAAICLFPGVQSAVASIFEVNPGDRRLVAYYVADSEVEPLELRRFLNANLADAMLPSFLEKMESFPLTSNGKIDRRALPAPNLNNLPPREVIAPGTETESRLLAIWSELLGHSALCINDEFFDVGGDSLLTLPLVFKLRENFGVEVPVTAIFNAPTIAGLANVIDRLLAGEEIAMLDLLSKVVLPSEIHPDNASPAKLPRSNPDVALITGATGFLGAYLVRELLDTTSAKIICLVRAKDKTDGLQRIRTNMNNYGLWQSIDQHRIEALPGDLGEPGLGLDQQTFITLAQQVDVIFHNGGQVNFLAPYESLEATNVRGTIDVLRLATTTMVKPVHLVSTLGVYLSEEYLDSTVSESAAPPSATSQHGGYNQSKWVGEQLALCARARGLPVAIYRPARVTGDSRTGHANLGDYFSSWIKGCVQLGMAPNFPDATFDMTPVDFLAQAMIKLALHIGDPNGNFHFLNPHRFPVPQLFNSLAKAGIEVPQVSYSTWRNALLSLTDKPNENTLSPFASLFTESVNWQEPKFDCSATEKVLAEFNIVCPPADEKLFDTYLHFMLEKNYLPVSTLMEDEV